MAAPRKRKPAPVKRRRRSDVPAKPARGKSGRDAGGAGGGGVFLLSVAGVLAAAFPILRDGAPDVTFYAHAAPFSGADAFFDDGHGADQPVGIGRDHIAAQRAGGERTDDAKRNQ